jgi:Bacterial alpha-L-rhamnosidase C-terminal domain
VVIKTMAIVAISAAALVAAGALAAHAGGSPGPQSSAEALAGIQPGAPGWRTFTLAPSVAGDLTHVAAQE